MYHTRDSPTQGRLVTWYWYHAQEKVVKQINRADSLECYNDVMEKAEECKAKKDKCL